MSDGKQLEMLVAFVEQTLVPKGFNVKVGKRVFDADGTPVAEFDVEITGKLGSTDIAWLIECRDRPSKGPAPSEWIQSLNGRRELFGFNKVTAVSTTGFSKSALEAADKLKIEVRTVTALSIDAFADWLALTHFSAVHRQCELVAATFLVSAPDDLEALQALVTNATGEAKLLKKSMNGDYCKPSEALLGLVEQRGLFDQLQVDGPDLIVHLTAEYVNDDDHFVVETHKGDVRIATIQFLARLRAKETLVPVTIAAEYKGAQSSETISQFVSFQPIDLGGVPTTLEIHRIPESGTHVLLRKAGAT